MTDQILTFLLYTVTGLLLLYIYTLSLAFYYSDANKLSVK